MIGSAAESQSRLPSHAQPRLTFDALIFPRHLPVIATLARHWPGLTFIIDHGAKPPIGDVEGTQAWREAILSIATLPNVACKLSGLITEAAAGTALDALTPYVDHLYAAFGPERLMWGSDWPVVNLRTPYQNWYDWTLTWLADKPVTAQFAILGRTAQQLYRIGE
ncbi:MAG: amidohydrolase family protein [Asticcacaulis sp.]